MPKDDLVYLGHMLDLARSAVAKAAERSRPEFDADENLRLALTHLIQTIGEAARQMSDEFRRRTPEIPWRKIIAMRHKVVHDYLHVDYDVVWDVSAIELPKLVELLTEAMRRQEAGGGDHPRQIGDTT